MKKNNKSRVNPVEINQIFSNTVHVQSTVPSAGKEGETKKDIKKKAGEIYDYWGESTGLTVLDCLIEMGEWASQFKSSPDSPIKFDHTPIVYSITKCNNCGGEWPNASSPDGTEISEDKIHTEGVRKHPLNIELCNKWIEGAKWYREQLKNR